MTPPLDYRLKASKIFFFENYSNFYSTSQLSKYTFCKQKIGQKIMKNICYFYMPSFWNMGIVLFNFHSSTSTDYKSGSRFTGTQIHQLKNFAILVFYFNFPMKSSTSRKNYDSFVMTLQDWMMSWLTIQLAFGKASSLVWLLHILYSFL